MQLSGGRAQASLGSAACEGPGSTALAHSSLGPRDLPSGPCASEVRAGGGAPGRKGRGQEGLCRSEAENWAPLPQHSPWSSHLARKALQAGWCLPLLFQGQA